MIFFILIIKELSILFKSYFLFYSPWQEYANTKTENKEKDLCSLVENILFVVMWRGVNIHNKNCWKVNYFMFNFCNNKNIIVMYSPILGTRSSYGMHKYVKFKQYVILFSFRT
jgi:hypothetical protein